MIVHDHLISYHLTLIPLSLSLSSHISSHSHLTLALTSLSSHHTLISLSLSLSSHSHSHLTCQGSGLRTGVGSTGNRSGLKKAGSYGPGLTT